MLSRSATSMFARLFYDLAPQLDIKSLFGSTDSEMISVLRQQSTGSPCESLLTGLFGTKRKLYKQVAEYSHNHTREIYTQIAGRPYHDIVDLSNRLTEQIEASQPLQPHDIIIDAPPPHKEVEFAIDVHFPKRNEFRPLQSVSPVVDALATRQFDDWVKRVRIFANPDVVDSISNIDWDAIVKKIVL